MKKLKPEFKYKLTTINPYEQRKVTLKGEKQCPFITRKILNSGVHKRFLKLGKMIDYPVP